MPKYEFECEAGKEVYTLKLSVNEYVSLPYLPMEGVGYDPAANKVREVVGTTSGVFCLEHSSNCKRVFSTFSFRM